MSRERTVNDYALIYEAIPDRHGTIEEIIAEEDKVFLHTALQGTHKGLMPGILVEPTGRLTKIDVSEDHEYIRAHTRLDHYWQSCVEEKTWP